MGWLDLVNATCYRQAMTEGQTRAHVGRFILSTTFWLTVFILSVKVSAAWAVQSLSLMAESLHTLLAGFSTFLSLLTIPRSDRLEEPFIYGHSKRETLITFLLVAILGFAGLNLLGLSAQQLVATVQRGTSIFPVRVSLALVQLLGVMVATTLGLAFLGIYQGRILRNASLRFNASQLLKDAVLTLLVLGGLLAVWWGIGWLDVLLAILLVLLAAGSCWQVVNWQLPLLVQHTAIAPEAIAQMARQVQGVTHCYRIQSRGVVGRSVYVQMHLVVHPDFIEFTPRIAERIEQAIQERYGPVHVTFHLDDDLLESMNITASNPPEVNAKHDQVSED
jgi:cation diffusion facilitator family transporter